VVPLVFRFALLERFEPQLVICSRIYRLWLARRNPAQYFPVKLKHLNLDPVFHYPTLQAKILLHSPINSFGPFSSCSQNFPILPSPREYFASRKDNTSPRPLRISRTFFLFNRCSPPVRLAGQLFIFLDL